MDLALLLCHGRHEVAHLQFSDIKDDTLYLIREKTKQYDSARIAIDMSSQLKEVVSRARAMPPLSQHLTHKSLRTGRRGALKPEMLTREFKKLRDELPMFQGMPAKERPSFHEIRALGANVLEDNGWHKDQIQHLMAYADVEMTELYLAGHKEK